MVNCPAETISKNSGFGKFGGSNDGGSTWGVGKNDGGKVRRRKFFSLRFNEQKIFAGQTKRFGQHGLNCELVAAGYSAAGQYFAAQAGGVSGSKAVFAQAL